MTGSPGPDGRQWAWAAAIVSGQLGRAPRARTGVAVTCPFGFPAVIETPPYLADGTPFPTLLYLTCPQAVGVVGRAEGAGGVEEFRRQVQRRDGLRRAMDELSAAYGARRAELAGRVRKWRAEQSGPAEVDGGAVLSAGIGGPGSAAEATCLHAYVAAVLAAEAGWLATSGPVDGGLGVLRGMGDLWCSDRRCAHDAPGGERRAAIDLGTNSVRLLVADLVGGRPQTVVRLAEVTRLGEGLGESAVFLPAARERTAAAVERYAQIAREAGAVSIILVGTNACRRADDGRSFVTALGRRFGLLARVVSGDEEAYLSFTGATLDLPGRIVLLDLGGGSTELVRMGPAGTLESTSVGMGCVWGTERWFSQDPPLPAERAAARAEVGDRFLRLAEQFGVAADPSGRLVGVAGTVTTLACQILGLREYSADAIHLQEISREDIRRQVDRLAGMSLDERASLPCMQVGRAEVIVAGGEILVAVMDALGWERLTVSERDILDGILVEGEPPG